MTTKKQRSKNHETELDRGEMRIQVAVYQQSEKDETDYGISDT